MWAPNAHSTVWTSGVEYRDAGAGARAAWAIVTVASITPAASATREPPFKRNENMTFPFRLLSRGAREDLAEMPSFQAPLCVAPRPAQYRFHTQPTGSDSTHGPPSIGDFATGRSEYIPTLRLGLSCRYRFRYRRALERISRGNGAKAPARRVSRRHIELRISPRSSRRTRVEFGPGLPRRIDGVCTAFERAQM